MSPNPRSIIIYTLTALIVAAFGGYAYFQADAYLSGPRLSVSSPTDGQGVSEQLVRIEGTAQNVSFLTLNGRQIYTDTEGRFAEPLLLHYGYNIITLTANGRFGRSKTETMRVVVK